jgi:hypothetical protein
MTAPNPWFREGWDQPPPPPGRNADIEWLWRRVDYIDANGTRGIGPIHAQLANVIGDLAELKTATNLWQERHLDEHKAAASNAVNGRRWVIGTCIAALGLLAVMLTLLFQIAGRIR